MIRASVAKELKERANENYKKYNRMKDEICNLIIFASNTGVGYCKYSESYNQLNDVMFGMLQSDLITLGYDVQRHINPKNIELYISW